MCQNFIEIIKRWEVLEDKILPSSIIFNTKVENMECCLFNRRRTIYDCDDSFKIYVLYSQINVLATDIDENVIAQSKTRHLSGKVIK